jgi:hypothetical protein
MRWYDEIVDVRKGLVAGSEAPEQFVWRGRRWLVRMVLGHWLETGSWWEQDKVSALLGSGREENGGTASAGPAAVAELLDEHEVWRVEAARSRDGSGVFDLAFSWRDACWRLRCCVD